ncbi:MAG: hypothetical protein JKY50_00500 [Oleispira sp.]|nr:hypothetical protein [Oleispira sp.]
MARTRNIILADIVVANGGTVTVPNNRNSLLQDWLDAVSGAEYNPILGITEVWIYGASISNALIEGYENVFSQRLTNLGHSGITFLDKSVGGRGIADTLIAWNAEKAAVTGRDDILIVTHCMGNTVSANRPWSGLSGAAQTVLFDEYQALIDSMTGNGQFVIPVGTSFRDYDGTTVNNEDAGSKPFNDNIVYPVTATIDPDMTDGAGLCYLDLYNFTRNNHADMLQGDGIHLNTDANQLNRDLWAKGIAQRLSGSNPIIIPRVESPNTDQVIPREDLTLFNNNNSAGSKVVFGGNDLGSTSSYKLASLLDYLPNSVIVTQNTFDTNFGNGTFYDDGDVTSSITNDFIKMSGIQTASTVFIALQVRSGYLPNQEVELTISSFRSIGTTGSRSGDFSIDGGSTFITLDASPSSSQHYHTFTAFADSGGNLTLSGRVNGGSGFLHLNGVQSLPK